LAGVLAGPAGFGEKPGDNEGGEELEPEWEGVAQAFKAGAADADGRGVFEEEEGADADAAGALLEEMDQEDDREGEEGVEGAGVGEVQGGERKCGCADLGWGRQECLLHILGY
jgi:hypothetical protein